MSFYDTCWKGLNNSLYYYRLWRNYGEGEGGLAPCNLSNLSLKPTLHLNLNIAGL